MTKWKWTIMKNKKADSMRDKVYKKAKKWYNVLQITI